MALRVCFRRFRSFQLLFINTAYTRLKDPFLNVRTPFPTLTPRVLRPFTLTRTLCSDGRQTDEEFGHNTRAHWVAFKDSESMAPSEVY